MVELLKANDVENIEKSTSNKKEAKEYKPFKSTTEIKEELPDLDKVYETYGNNISKEIGNKKPKNWENAGYKREGKNIYYLYYYNSDSSKTYEKISDAHAGTFEVLDYWYAEDKNKVYYKGKEIMGGGKKMEVVDGGYAKDTQNVYYYGQKIEGILPKDFDATTFKNVEGRGYANEYRKDANRVYYKGKIISEDAKNFAFSGMIYQDGYAIDPSFSSATMYYKDSKNTYLDGEILVPKIEFFGEEGLGGFVRIDDKIYYETGSAARLTDKEVAGADAESFHVTDNGTFQDKNNIYYFNPIMGMMPRKKSLN